MNAAPFLVFEGGRLSGKTTAIIEWLREDPRRRVWLRTSAERRQYLDAGISSRQLLLGGPHVTRGYTEVAVEKSSRFQGGWFSVFRTWSVPQ